MDSVKKYNQFIKEANEIPIDNNLNAIKANTLVYNKYKTKVSTMFSNAKPEDINKISIIPQMTFRINSEFLIPVMKKIVYNKNTNTKSKKDLSIDYKNIEIVEKCVDELIKSFEFEENSKLEKIIKTNLKLFLNSY